MSIPQTTQSLAYIVHCYSPTDVSPESYYSPTIPQYHDYETSTNRVPQRICDGYLSATRICSIGGRKFSTYASVEAHHKHLHALARDLGVYYNDIVQISNKGTWVHPEVARHLAGWLSPCLQQCVIDWVNVWESYEANEPIVELHPINLPFTSDAQGANFENLHLWTVYASGDFETDREAGASYALEYLEYYRATDENLLPLIIADMPASHTGLETGFLETVTK